MKIEDNIIAEVTEELEASSNYRARREQVTAFNANNKYLKKGAPGYEDKFRFQPEDAISHILNAGGIPVLAHPATLKCKTEEALDAEIKKLMNYLGRLLAQQ